MNGLHLFSIYVYDRHPIKLNMLVITRYGARRINSICEKCLTQEEIYRILYKYFNLILNDEIVSKKDILNQIIPTLANHYYMRGKCESPTYDTERLRGRCLCILYPLNITEISAISDMLIKISIAKEDRIEKEQLRCL